MIPMSHRYQQRRGHCLDGSDQSRWRALYLDGSTGWLQHYCRPCQPDLLRVHRNKVHLPAKRTRSGRYHGYLPITNHAQRLRYWFDHLFIPGRSGLLFGRRDPRCTTVHRYFCRLVSFTHSFMCITHVLQNGYLVTALLLHNGITTSTPIRLLQQIQVLRQQVIPRSHPLRHLPSPTTDCSGQKLTIKDGPHPSHIQCILIM